MDCLDRQIEYYKKHQNELALNHHGKIVLICNESIIDFYETKGEANTDALNKKFEPGTFLIRQCLKPEEEPVAQFHSRVAFE